MTDGTSRIAEAVRDACLEAWRAAFERAFISGLGAEGAAEAALGAVRALDLVPVVTDLAGAPGMSDPSPPQHTGTSEEPARPSGEGLRGPPQLAEIIATHVAEGLCLMDTEGRLTYMNPAAEEILGWRQEEIRGRVLHDVVHDRHPDSTPFPAEEYPLLSVLRSGVTLRDREDVWIRKGGEFVPVFCSCAPILEGGCITGAVLSLHEITQRRRAEQELQRTLERYRLLGRATRDTLWEWDLITGEGSWNVGIQTMFGYPAEEVLPTHEWWAERVHPDDRERVIAGTRAAIEGGAESWQGEYRFRRADRTYAAVLDRAYIARDPEGRPLRIVGSMLDITERRRVEEERVELLAREREAREEAERANRAKADFLAVMSHELRTPLTAIMGYAELLEMGIPDPVPEGARQQVERIDRAARHLLQLIEEILTFSRIEAGKEGVRRSEAEVGEVAREAADFVQPLAAHKGLSLRLQGPEAPLALQTDRGKLRQVLVNLLFNAVKFTAEGEVRLEVEPAGETVRLHVRDTGVGIPPEHRERIFEPFWQGQQVNTRVVGGTGLGLAISRRIVHLLGGEIRVESVVGRGTVFTVELPLRGGEGPDG